MKNLLPKLWFELRKLTVELKCKRSKNCFVVVRLAGAEHCYLLRWSTANERSTGQEGSKQAKGP